MKYLNLLLVFTWGGLAIFYFISQTALSWYMAGIYLSLLALHNLASFIERQVK